MNISVEGEITIAYCRHCNGPDTHKQMEIDAMIDIDDPEIRDPADRWANFRFSVPVSRKTKLGDHDELVGKKVKIEIGG